MDDAAAPTTFELLLEEERDAARRADIDALVALQERKQAALGELGAAGLSHARIDAIGRRARENVSLMRHLVSLLGATIGIDDNAATYGRAGERRSVVPATIRGAL